MILALAETGKLKRQGEDKKRSKNPQDYLVDDDLFALIEAEWAFFSSSKHFLSFFICVLTFSIIIEIKEVLTFFNFNEKQRRCNSQPPPSKFSSYFFHRFIKIHVRKALR